MPTTDPAFHSPPPVGDLPALQTYTHDYTTSVSPTAPKELSNPVPTCREHASATIGLSLPVTLTNERLGRARDCFHEDQLKNEAPLEPDITQAKQCFDQLRSRLIPTTTKAAVQVDASEAGSTLVLTPSFWSEKWDEERNKDVKSVAESEGATPLGHAMKGRMDASSMKDHTEGNLKTFSGSLGKGAHYPGRGLPFITLIQRLCMGGGFQRESKVDPSPGTTCTENEARESNTPSRPPLISSRKLSDDPYDLTSVIDSVAAEGPDVDSRVLGEIGEPDYSGWLYKKGDQYSRWTLRYFVLKGTYLYCLNGMVTGIEGCVDITGSKLIRDKNIYLGRYGFGIVHDTAKLHRFSSSSKAIAQGWIKALMRATLQRCYNVPVRSSCNAPTISLAVAQQMVPTPRPPSPSDCKAIQRAFLRPNPDHLWARDVRVLMGLPEIGPPTRLANQCRIHSFPAPNEQNSVFNNSRALRAPPPAKAETSFASTVVPTGPSRAAETNQPVWCSPSAAPARPSREMKPWVDKSAGRTSALSTEERELIDWVNSKLPPTCPLAKDLSTSMSSGLILFRLAEWINGANSGVPDSDFSHGPGDDRLDDVFELFDFLRIRDVCFGAVSVNDVRNGNAEKIAQLVRALKSWDEDRQTSIALRRAVDKAYQAEYSEQ